MVLYSLTFYLFSSVAVLSALMVISAKNPVHSVLFLILSFVNASGLFVLLGAEFLALILMIVYVGAVAVLFMFVVMMLNINFKEIKSNLTKYLPLGILVGLVLFVELGLIFGDFIPELKFNYAKSNEISTYFIQEMLYRGFLANTRLGTTFAYSDKIINKYLENTNEVFRKIKKFISLDKKFPLKGPIRHTTFKRLI